MQPNFADCQREPQVACPCSKCHEYRAKNVEAVQTIGLRAATILLLAQFGITESNHVKFSDCVHYSWPQHYIGLLFGDALKDCTPVMLAAVFHKHIPYLPIVRI